MSPEGRSATYIFNHNWRKNSDWVQENAFLSLPDAENQLACNCPTAHSLLHCLKEFCKLTYFLDAPIAYWFMCTFMRGIKARAMQLSLGNFFENLGLKEGANDIIQLVYFCFVFLELSCNKISKKEFLISIEIVKKIKKHGYHILLQGKLQWNFT